MRAKKRAQLFGDTFNDRRQLNEMLVNIERELVE